MEVEISRSGERRVSAETRVPRPVAETFAFFADPANLSRITPSRLGFKLVRMSSERIQAGTELDYRISMHGLPLSWRSRIAEWLPNYAFADEQVRGPFATWYHRHLFAPAGPGETVIRDEVRYRLPLGRLGSAMAGRLVDRDVREIFTFRGEALQAIFGPVAA